jgi:hypothetical protein
MPAHGRFEHFSDEPVEAEPAVIVARLIVTCRSPTDRYPRKCLALIGQEVHRI